VSCRFPQLFVALVLLSTAGACKKAPDAPTGEPPGALTLFPAFFADQEILDPVLLPLYEEGVVYEAEGRDDCYRSHDLSLCDVLSTCVEGVDPTDVPSLVHAEVLDYPVQDVERALLQADWIELFPSNYNSYEVVAEEGKDEYLAGDKHFYMRQYQAVMPVLNAEIASVTNLQFRRIDDWNGSGHPAVIVRGWYPEQPVSNSENVTSTMMFSYELLAPWEDNTRTMRLFFTWSDLMIGSLSVGEAWNIACGQSKAGWSDLDDWISDNPS
jgi:hypothetical protein